MKGIFIENYSKIIVTAIAIGNCYNLINKSLNVLGALTCNPHLILQLIHKTCFIINYILLQLVLSENNVHTELPQKVNE